MVGAADVRAAAAGADRRAVVVQGAVLVRRCRRRPADPSERDGVQHLLLRYLAAFGPASVADFAQFSMLRRPIVTQARQALAERVEQLEGPDGTVLLDLPGAPRPDGDAEPPPRLLPMWDSVLLAYADRSRVIPADYRSLVIRRNGDVLPTLLVDGHVAGVWRPVEGGIEATAFHRLDRASLAGARDRGGGPAGFPGRARTDGVPALRPLVAQGPARRGGPPAP